MKTVSEDLARELVDFAPTRATREMGFGESQLHGAVAAHNMLARNRVAYLADEVGMGKTYVALGVLGLLRHLDPLARVMVIAPRENIQRKWVKELTNFVRINWKIEDNRVKGMDGRPARGATVCHSLVELADVERLNDDNDLFLRSTSFSASVRDSDAQNRLRRPLLRRIPWIPRHRLRIGHPLEFRDRYGRALNAIFPDIDLLIVDEAHGLKHGFDRRGSNRNRVMGIALGHPVGDDGECSWYRPRVSRVLLLSATPFEYDYRDVYNQLDVLGMGNARLTDADGSDPLEVSRLADPEVDEEEKREVLGRMLVRRVGYLKIGDRRYSKNMYRREWRAGGYRAPIEPMRLTDARERLVVGLVQKKVAELLGDRRFNNSFQIGMLSSFESFLETVGRQRARAAAGNGDDPESGVRHFEGEQEANAIERRGIDTDSLASIARSYREAFGRPLPHPKLDATARALASVFGTGDKALVFVRRVATVGELKSKLDRVFDDWLERKMRVALPELDAEVAGLFRRYRQGNEVEPGTPEGDSSHGDVDQEDEEILEAVVDDEGGEDTFFAWFFRGEGPDGVLSGGSFQKNRLSSMASVYSTIFEDDYVSWLLGRPGDPIDGLAEAVGMDRESLEPKLRADAFRYFRARSRQQSGYPRFYVVEAYQVVGLRLLHDCGGDLGHRAGIVLHERFPPVTEVDGPVPGGFPGPAVGIGISTFFTELVKRDVLRRQIWPEDAAADFGERLRGRERRRELLSAMARLGATFIDLYLTFIRLIGSFQVRAEMEGDRPEQTLVRAFLDLLERQFREPGFHAFAELSKAAAAFDTILAVNFPNAHYADLWLLPEMFGRALQHQIPVGRMSGGVNKRLVQQFRMPGFPLVLATTDVLQEGEDLHTFCRRVIHYGITWTPSAMEQRTGRIDRIGSLVQRELDGRPRPPEGDELLQVYYPYLEDTVEVFQVRRVLERLNTFLRMTHRGEKAAEADDSRVNVAQEALRPVATVPHIEGLLESAFPVPVPWLQGTAMATDIHRPDVGAIEERLQEWWRGFIEHWGVRVELEGSLRHVAGTMDIQDGRCCPGTRLDPVRPVRRQPFVLALVSHRADGGTLVECSSPVGRLDLNDDGKLEHLYELQQRIGLVRIAIEHDLKTHLYEVSIRADRMFHLDTAQREELDYLICHTVEAADVIEMEMIGKDRSAEEWFRELNETEKD